MDKATAGGGFLLPETRPSPSLSHQHSHSHLHPPSHHSRSHSYSQRPHSNGHGYSRSVDSGSRHYGPSPTYSLFPTVQQQPLPHQQQLHATAQLHPRDGDAVFHRPQPANMNGSGMREIKNFSRPHMRSQSNVGSSANKQTLPQRTLSWLPPLSSAQPTGPVVTRSGDSNGCHHGGIPPPRAITVPTGDATPRSEPPTEGKGKGCSFDGSSETSAGASPDTDPKSGCARRSSSVYSQDADLDHYAASPTERHFSVSDKAHLAADGGSTAATTPKAPAITSPASKGSSPAAFLSPRSLTPLPSPLISPLSPRPQRPARPKYGLYEKHSSEDDDDDDDDNNNNDGDDVGDIDSSSSFYATESDTDCDVVADDQKDRHQFQQGVADDYYDGWDDLNRVSEQGSESRGPALPDSAGLAHANTGTIITSVSGRPRVPNQHDDMAKDSLASPPPASSSLSPSPPPPPPKLPPPPPSKQPSHVAVSDNVRHLIQEADQAFDAVGSSFENESFMHSYTLNPASSSPEPPPGASQKPTTQPRSTHGRNLSNMSISSSSSSVSSSSSPPTSLDMSRDQQNKATNTTTKTTNATNITAINTTAALHPASASTRVSATKPQRKGTAKRGVAWPGGWHAKAMRWTLTENMTEIITGQKFKRIEADEMLTPDQMEELRRSRDEARREEELQEAARNSSESVRTGMTDKTETSDEPFHLETLASKIATPHPNEVSPDPSSQSRNAPNDPNANLTDLSVLREDSSGSEYSDDADDEDEKDDIVDSSTPALPAKNPARFASRPHMKRLSTIPEILTNPRTSVAHGVAEKVPVIMVNDANDANESTVCLESTPFTLTKPAFRHGPITFQRGETSKGQQSLEEIDEALDWTAFQMAILGGAGELEPSLDTETDELQLAEDMTTWFADFGFDSHGKLVSGSAHHAPRSAGHSPSSSTSTINTDSELPIPVSSEPMPIRWRTSDVPAPLDPMKFLRSKGPRKWPVDSAARSDSPMVVGDAGVDESTAERMSESRVAMGCNLVSDLDDFLKWETQHVYSDPVM